MAGELTRKCHRAARGQMQLLLPWICQVLCQGVVCRTHHPLTMSSGTESPPAGVLPLAVTFKSVGKAAVSVGHLGTLWLPLLSIAVLCRKCSPAPSGHCGGDASWGECAKARGTSRCEREPSGKWGLVDSVHPTGTKLCYSHPEWPSGRPFDEASLCSRPQGAQGVSMTGSTPRLRQGKGAQ